MTSGNKTEGNIELSIIILSYNTAKVTGDCISSIYESFENNETKFEVIVFDNSSTDNSLKTLHEQQKKYKNLSIIESKENVGYGRGNNTAVKSAKGDYLLFLNSDVIVLDNAIDILLDCYKNHKSDVHFTGGKLFNKDGSAQPSCGPFYTLPVVFAALFLKGDYWGLTRYSPNETKKVDWVSGACILTTKEIFNNVGGFDEQIFMYMDEIELLYRASILGFNTYFFPQAHFTHLGSASSNGKTYPILQVYKGFLYFYKKHCSVFSLRLLKGMLKLKALAALTIGRLTGKPYLVNTYEQALKIV